MQRARDQADKAGLLADKEAKEKERPYPFQTIATEDPNLALAGLRIEIERRLVQLAESRDLSVGRSGLGRLLRDLNARELINGQERAVLADLTALLSSAVHGAAVDPRATEWAISIGPQILAALDERIASKEVRYGGIT